VNVDFDPIKSAKNDRDRGLPFSKAAEFDWANAVFSEDSRHAYPERRFVASGFIGDRLHIVCFTPITGGIRVISFRKANQREVKRHEQATPDR
jgi:uncharacterized DUF497 family protein